MKNFRVKYQYTSAASGALITKHVCYYGSTPLTTEGFILWAKGNTIGGRYNYKIRAVLAD